jgi:hypothetical protein
MTVMRTVEKNVMRTVKKNVMRTVGKNVVRPVKKKVEQAGPMTAPPNGARHDDRHFKFGHPPHSLAATTTAATHSPGPRRQNPGSRAPKAA